MQNKLQKQLAENFPHVMSTELKMALIIVLKNIAPAQLGLSTEELQNSLLFPNWNYKQCAAVFNCFYSVPFKEFEQPGDSTKDSVIKYRTITVELKRMVDKWNSVIQPIKESLDRQQQLSVAKKSIIAHA